ncbi:MAG: hypothetical protein GF347_02330 [Candidatus Moranbacteria bacterium]|nr:hypothetical protein [Candidatus Moranbacteria bacterium]
MKKIKKSALYLTAVLLTFVFSRNNLFASYEFPVAEYGVTYTPTSERIRDVLSVIFFPVGLLIITPIVLAAGIFIYLRRRKKKK